MKEEPYISNFMKKLMIPILLVTTYFSMWHGVATYAGRKGGMTKIEIEQKFSDITYKKGLLGDLQNITGKPGRGLVYLLMGTGENQ